MKIIKSSINSNVENILGHIVERGREIINNTKNKIVKNFSLFINIDRFLFNKCDVFSMATLEDFQKLDIRVGKIIDIKDAETRKPMYVLKIDFGEIGIKQAIAGIKPFYSKEELLNKKFAFVVNLEPKKIANILSECMILAATCNDKEKVVILQPEKDIEIGSKVS